VLGQKRDSGNRKFLFFTYVNVRGQKRDRGNPALANKKIGKIFVSSKFWQWSHQINMLERRNQNITD